MPAAVSESGKTNDEVWYIGVALDPNLNQQDGIHPNKAGTIVISNTIQDIMSKNY